MTNELRHTVAVYDNTFHEWLPLASFRWFNDAKDYAVRASKNDKLRRVLVIENSNRPTYFQHGAEIDDCVIAA